MYLFFYIQKRCVAFGWRRRGFSFLTWEMGSDVSSRALTGSSVSSESTSSDSSSSDAFSIFSPFMFTTSLVYTIKIDRSNLTIYIVLVSYFIERGNLATDFNKLHFIQLLLLAAYYNSKILSSSVNGNRSKRWLLQQKYFWIVAKMTKYQLHSSLTRT